MPCVVIFTFLLIFFLSINITKSSKLLFKNGSPPVIRSVCNGFFKDDKLDGQGEMNYAVGHRYIGEWKNGKKDGFGKLYYNDGNLYIGCWDSDQRHGKGKFIWNRMLKSQMEF